MTDREREVIVTNDGSSAGALVAGIVAVLLIVFAVWYLGFRPAADDADVNINVEVPESVPETVAP
jgi:hypothetical protein